MSNITGNIDISLEDQIFKHALYFGIIVIASLFIYDILFSGDYLSVMIEVAAGIVFAINFFMVSGQRARKRHRHIFSVVLVILMDFGWITGGGISILMAAINFLVLGFILIVNDSRFYRTIFLLFFFNYVLLFIIEYVYHFNLLEEFEPNKPDIIKQYLITLFLSVFGGYLIVFLKLNYNKERSSLKMANTLLQEKTKEISEQNEALVTAKEIVDKTVDKLEQQTGELKEIKGSLEEKVNERTEDLVKLNERLLVTNQQLEQYAYITSHNLRAPIAQIKGLIHLLPNDQVEPKYKIETLDRLHESVEKLEKVFTDLSLILKIDKGAEHPWQEVDLIAIMDEVLESLEHSFQHKNIKVNKPSSHQAVLVKAIRPYVHSVFLNIIENAIKYSDDTKTKKKITIDYVAIPKYQKVAVTDNGVGIDMKVASGKLFQMYQRFHDTHPGEGFGLFLVKTQMEAMGGMVELDSMVGQGSTFNLYFPIH